MAAMDGLTFEGVFNSVTVGKFKDNTTNAIIELYARELVTAIRESYLNRIDDLPFKATAVVTSGGTITCDCGEARIAMFFGGSSFATAKILSFINSTENYKRYFSFEITDPAATLEIPDALMSDPRWDGTLWTPDGIGKFELEMNYNGSEYNAKITGPYA